MADLDAHDDLYSRVVSRFPSLTCIDAGYITPKGLLTLAMNCGSELHTVRFMFTPIHCDLSSDAVKRLCLACPKLTNISFDFAGTDSNVKTLVQYCPQLQRLSLGGSTITNNTLPIISTLTSLKYLNLKCSESLTNTAFIALIKKLPLLEELSTPARATRTANSFNALVGNMSTDSDLLTCIGTYCPHLIKLYLGYGHLPTNDSVLALARGCPHLEQVRQTSYIYTSI